MLHNLVIPVDLTDTGKKALEIGSKISKEFNSKVWIITVIEKPNIPFLQELPEEERNAVLSLNEKLKNKAIETLESYKDYLKTKNIEVDYKILEGDTVESILDFCETVHPDLIIMPSHQKSDIELKAIGSVSLRVASKSKYPVLVIKGNLNFDKIVVAYDFLPSSQEGLQFAVNLAKHFGSQLIVVHADNDSNFSHLKSVLEKVRQHKLEKLSELKNIYEDIKLYMEEGNPDKVIIKKAVEEKADLILVGKRQVKEGKRTFIGSTSYKILKESAVSVLIYRGNYE